MGSYVTGIFVAFCIVFGLYFSMELSTGNSVFAQDTLDNENDEQLRLFAEDFTSDDQIEAIVQLGVRPGDLRKTVSVLAKLATVQNELVRNAADLSLATIGEPGAIHLKPFVEQDSTEGFRIACAAMKSIGPSCKIYLDDVKRLLLDDDPIRRRCGLYALQGMGEDGKSAIAEVITCVLDKDLNNQCSACRVLETYGNDAYEAEEALLQLLNEGGPSTRGWAAVCLGAIGPTSSEVDVAKLLAERLSPRSDGRPITPIEQERILNGLAHLGPEAEKVQDSVLAKMNGKNKYVSGHAAYAYWRITGDLEKPMLVLKGLMEDPNYQVDAMVLVSKMGTAGSSMAKVVARGLQSSDVATREQAIIALGNFGEAAIGFTEEIEKRFQDSDALVRLAARRAVAQLNEIKKEKAEKAEKAEKQNTNDSESAEKTESDSAQDK